MATYKNPWYNPRILGSHEEFTTNVKPVDYKGYLLYHRVESTTAALNVWDVVKDGVCLTERMKRRQRPAKRKCCPPKNTAMKCPHCRSRKIYKDGICVGCGRKV
jgi:hypothetical protein